jgi:hypothetical protein
MTWNPTTSFVSGAILTAVQMNDISNDLDVLRGDFATARRTGGNLTLNSTNWANVDTATDVTLAAAAGDVVETVLSGLWNTAGVFNFLDVVTVVGGSPVNSFATQAAVTAATGEGVMAWYAPQNTIVPVGGSAFYTLVSGDISGGTVTLRARYRSSSGTNRDLLCTASNPFVVVGRNHGPVQI